MVRIVYSFLTKKHMAVVVAPQPSRRGCLRLRLAQGWPGLDRWLCGDAQAEESSLARAACRGRIPAPGSGRVGDVKSKLGNRQRPARLSPATMDDPTPYIAVSDAENNLRNIYFRSKKTAFYLFLKMCRSRRSGWPRLGWSSAC